MRCLQLREARLTNPLCGPCCDWNPFELSQPNGGQRYTTQSPSSSLDASLERPLVLPMH